MTAEEIVRKAHELGYLTCGIIPVSDMAGYDEKLSERIAYFPETEKNMRSCVVLPIRLSNIRGLNPLSSVLTGMGNIRFHLS